jgi:ketosteroid isomerase-like protein
MQEFLIAPAAGRMMWLLVLVPGVIVCLVAGLLGSTVLSSRNARFAHAWNRHDLDALMSMMTDDCVFEASAGPEMNGQRSQGKQAVRAAYAAVFETFPDAHWANARHFIAGNRGVSEWTFTGTRSDGTRVEVNGCDLVTFRGGKIAIKNSYRKNRS